MKNTEMSDNLVLASTHRKTPLPGHVSSDVWRARNKRRISKEQEENKPSNTPVDNGNDLEENSQNQKPKISRRQFKYLLSSNKELLKTLVLKNISKEELLKLLKKKRDNEKAFSENKTLKVSESVNSSTEQISARFSGSSQESPGNVCFGYAHHDLYLELAKTVLNATQADRVIVYLSRSSGAGLAHAFSWPNHSLDAKLRGSAVVSHAARHVERFRTGLLIEDASQDKRFNHYAVVVNDISLICIPLIDLEKDLVGVIELTRGQERIPFTEKEYQIAQGCIVWACLGINQNLKNYINTRTKNLNTFLLDATNDMFHDVTQFHDVMAKIMTHSKALVCAERCVVALLDKVHSELYVELQDVGEYDADGKPVYRKFIKALRFPIKDTNIIIEISNSCSTILNNACDDTYKCLFKELSATCDADIRNLLSVRVMNKGEFFGVFVVANKCDGGQFCEDDAEMLKVFGIYFSMALNYSKVYSDMKVKEDCANVAIEQLQSQCMKLRKSVGENLMKSGLQRKDIPLEFYTHLFSIDDEVKNILDKFFVFMIHDLFGNVLDELKLCSFTEAVYRNYRTVPYHNWQHAFYVAHCMYIVLRDPFMKSALTDLERLSLLIACICHDLDHRGYNNTFFEKLNLPLAALYSTSVMEQHHFHTTVLILQQENNTIFDHFTTEQYQTVLTFIRHAIISTDLAVFFGCNKPALEGLVKNNTFDVSNREHRDIMVAVTMTACDLCAAAKPWPKQVRSVKALYDEFYVQGDIERDRGFEPIAMMNRYNNEKLADQQSGFMKFVAVPLYTTLGKVIPVVQDIEKTVRENLDSWLRVGTGENIPPWEPSITSTIGTDNRWAHKESLRSVRSLFISESD